MLFRCSFAYILLYCLGLFNTNASAQAEIYPFTEGAKTANDFSVTIDGKEVQVYDAPVAAVAQFGIDTETTIKIRSEFDIKRVDIRPKSLNIQYTLIENVLSIKLIRPCKISVELNANIMRPLFIFANAKTTDKPNANDSKVKFFKAGKIYDIGRVAINSNETVYIEAGAIVRGSFKSNNSENITLRGNGILEAKSKPGNDTNGKFIEDWGRTVNFKKCKNVKILDIIILDSHTWDVVPDLCTNVIIKNIKIASGNPADDGMDIVSCQDVLIEDCFIRAKDDCIAIKAFDKDTVNRDVLNINVKRCTFWNAEWGNAFEIGFETRTQRIANIKLEDCDIIHVTGGAAFSIHLGDWAKVENIQIENIRIEDATQKLVDMAIFFSYFSKDNPFTSEDFMKNHYLQGTWDNVIKVNSSDKNKYEANRGSINNVVFKNIEVLEGNYPFSVIEGFSEKHKITNVSFENVKIYGRKIKQLEDMRLFVKHASGISIK